MNLVVCREVFQGVPWFAGSDSEGLGFKVAE